MHEWRITRLVVKSGHQIDMCYDNIELCAQNIKKRSRFNSEHNWEALCDCLISRIIITLTSYPFRSRNHNGTLCDSRLLTRGDISRANPTAKTSVWSRKCPR